MSGPVKCARQATVSILLVRAVVETLERRGTSRADLFARIGLDARRLDEPEARLELDEFERVLASAAAMTGDDALGLHVAEKISDVTFDVLGHLAARAPTLRESVVISSQFGNLAIDGTRLVARDEGDAFVVCCAFPRGTPLWDRTFAELMTAGLGRMARAFVGPSAIPRLVTFEHDQPKHFGEYTRILGNNLRFRESETSIAFDRELADKRQIHQHPELYSLLRAEAERQLDRMTTGVHVSVRLRQYLLAIPPSRIPNMAGAARHLSMSERSLRRRLSAEGTSYREVLRSALERSASRMLREPACTIKETAVALGFGDAAAFVNAFKRWTGTTPGEYRRARLSG